MATASGQGPQWISAAEAARLLRVNRATLYAYVSRGFVRSQPVPGAARERAYAREDVERLRRQTEERRNPDKAAARALQWGMPILESSIALIDGQRLYYRGHDAVELSRSRSVQEVASLIWTGRFDATFSATPATPAAAATADAEIGAGTSARVSASAARLAFVPRAQTLLARAAAHDPLGFDLRAESVAATGWRILDLLTRAAALPHAAPSATASASATAAAAAAARPHGTRPSTSRVVARASAAAATTVDETLAHAWGVSARGVDLLRSALILCADHELNVSSFTARCVASAGSHPYAVVIAGLAALEGPRHGGISARVEAMLDALHPHRRRNLRDALAERLRRGETIDGFGHPLYRDRDGDPRAAALLALLRDRYAKSPELAFVTSVADAAAVAIREKPTIDFALAALARVLRLPPGSPLTLFAIGRTIGWIGHAIEQYATGQLIRPRAKYVGVPPTPASASTSAPAPAPASR
jgi:citrate synthase